ncbi:MAG: two-component sensor histidine kinase [Comamonadaceae bacterium CG1_02_60_18]|nr:MAG: two-component sensor histidine kinase [Comamonadaceae bacterium CG1_02_60_18]PIQ54319.1 MAG: two-component sensor histidine kinase [Comamonadaceae bacterium CG12_big_fil_rev_8_21_14_0_65_59_15]
MPRLSSLQARLLSLLVLLVTLVWLSAAAFTWFDTSDELDELLDGHLAQSAALLVAQQGRNLPERHSDDDTPLEDAPSLHKYAPRVAFQVFHEGALVLRSANAGSAPMSTKTRGFSTVELTDQKQWRVFGAQGSEGDVQVFVAEQVKSRDSILWAVLKGVLTPLMYALPLLAVVGWLAVRQGLAPLRHLSSALAQRQPQALEPVTLQDLPSEIQPVVQSLNALFERIGRMMASERRFTADAAHELRTPIAAIRMQAQVALAAGDDTATREHALAYTLAGCDRATHLVEQLLTLSRLESSSASAPTGTVDVSAVTRRVAADLALAALGRAQDLVLEADAPCPIAADDMLTSVLVRNLLDNAMRYSPAGAHVQVAVSCTDTHVMLQVDDSGPGLSDANMAKLGERFFRVLGTEQTGSGLGWSIVRRIAAVYQAQVAVQRSDRLGGLCISVRWPRKRSAETATS